jgi:hypothetical protein
MLERKHSSPHGCHERSWPPAIIASRSAHHGTQGSKQSLEPRSAAEAGSRLSERARDHPFHCECSPFCHSNKSPLAQKSKLSNLANLSNGKVTAPRITENNGKLCPNRTAGSNCQFCSLTAKIRLGPQHESHIKVSHLSNGYSHSLIRQTV